MCEKKIGRLIMILFLKMCCATVLRKTDSKCCHKTCKLESLSHVRSQHFFRSTTHDLCVKLLLMKEKLLSASLKHVMLHSYHPIDFLKVSWKFIGHYL